MERMPHFVRVLGDGRCGATASSALCSGSLLVARMRFFWLDFTTSRFRGVNCEVRSLGFTPAGQNHQNHYLKVHPINWAWGVNDETLQTLVRYVGCARGGCPGAGRGKKLGAMRPTLLPVPPPLPVQLHMCPACTSADVWSPATDAGVEVRWDQPFNLFHPDPLFATCTCWDLLTCDKDSLGDQEQDIPPCYGPN
eukprot:jgi/Botrbrau1/16244/Bobra.0066s0029.1